MVNPTDYTSFDNQQKSKVLYVIDEFAEDLIDISGKCMDIGCGPGDITKNILLPALDSNAIIIGTDISKSMIEYANKTYGDKKRLKFEVLDAQTKSLPQKYISEFDHIFSFHALHWCSDIRQAFKNIYHMLRPDGTMLVLLVESHDIFEVIKVMAQDIRFASYIHDVKKYISPLHDSTQPRKELKELLKSIGFEIRHCSLRETTFTAKNSSKFLSSIISILSFLDDMPDDKVEEFKDAFTHEYIRRKINYEPIHNQGQSVLDLYTILIVHARRTQEKVSGEVVIK